MYDGKQYDTYSFVDANTVKVITLEKDYFYPDFTHFVSSCTIPLEKAIRIWAAEDEGIALYSLYSNYFAYRDQFGEEHAAEFRALARAAGKEIDASLEDLRAFIKHWRAANV